MLLAYQALQIFLIFSAISFGSSLVCNQCAGNECNADAKDMETCESNDFCYLTRNNLGETRGCDASEGCVTSRGRRGGQFQHYVNVNGNVCQICNQRLCNGDSGTGPRTVDCFKCEGDECKADDSDISTCEGTICFFALTDGVERRGCGDRPYISAASSAFQSSCTYDKCNSRQRHDQTQHQVQEQMNNLGARLREDQMRLQYNLNAQMKNFGETMAQHMNNVFGHMYVQGR